MSVRCHDSQHSRLYPTSAEKKLVLRIHISGHNSVTSNEPVKSQPQPLVIAPKVHHRTGDALGGWKPEESLF